MFVAQGRASWAAVAHGLALQARARGADPSAGLADALDGSAGELAGSGRDHEARRCRLTALKVRAEILPLADVAVSGDLRRAVARGRAADRILLADIDARLGREPRRPGRRPPIDQPRAAHRHVGAGRARLDRDAGPRRRPRPRAGRARGPARDRRSAPAGAAGADRGDAGPLVADAERPAPRRPGDGRPCSPSCAASTSRSPTPPAPSSNGTAPRSSASARRASRSAGARVRSAATARPSTSTARSPPRSSSSATASCWPTPRSTASCTPSRCSHGRAALHELGGLDGVRERRRGGRVRAQPAQPRQGSEASRTGRGRDALRPVATSWPSCSSRRRRGRRSPPSWSCPTAVLHDVPWGLLPPLAGRAVSVNASLTRMGARPAVAPSSGTLPPTDRRVGSSPGPVSTTPSSR